MKKRKFALKANHEEEEALKASKKGHLLISNIYKNLKNKGNKIVNVFNTDRWQCDE